MLFLYEPAELQRFLNHLAVYGISSQFADGAEAFFSSRIGRSQTGEVIGKVA